MPKPTDQYDVWFQTVNAVYTSVPYSVVAAWCGEGRVAPSDLIRVHSTRNRADDRAGWRRADEYHHFTDYFAKSLPEESQRRRKAPKFQKSNNGNESQPLGGEEYSVTHWRRPQSDDDDDVDLIPLIDVSLVLLIYFLMTAAVTSSAPIDLPVLKNTGPLGGSPEAITITVDRRGETPLYGLRVGERPAAKDDSNLDTAAALLARLDTRLTGDRPPEVRIACDKALPRKYVAEIARQLDGRKREGKISGYGAEVNMVPPQ